MQGSIFILFRLSILLFKSVVLMNFELHYPFSDVLKSPTVLICQFLLVIVCFM